MNQHRIHVFCGQIKFIHEFFKDYKDDKVTITIDQLNKIDMKMTVETELSGEETEKYIKQLLKQSSLGSALYYSVKYSAE